MKNVDQLVSLAKALASEVERLKAEIPDHGRNQSINFYDEVERYEIDLLKKALNECGGNQSKAAKLLHLKLTTLNAKLKHYGLNPVRSRPSPRQNTRSI